jgi:hypothetical protein
MKAVLASLLSFIVCQSLAADSTLTRVIRPGVMYQRTVREEGPWVINALHIDLLQEDLKIASAKALDMAIGRETTSSLAKRMGDSLWDVVAALNADFFEADGETVSNQIEGGMFVRALALGTSIPGRVRSQFALTLDGRPLIDRFGFSGYVRWKEDSVTGIVGVNVAREKLGPSLFNRYWGPATRIDSEGVVVREVPLLRVGDRGDTVLCIIGRSPEVGGGMAIPDSGMVLSTYHDSPLLDPARVKPGDTVRVLFLLSPGRGKISNLVGGTPRIVVDGKSVAGLDSYGEGTPAEFSSKRHPRTGIGFSRDSTTLYFVTVDGRQASSVGMSLPEFADLMISLGVFQGLNLDGGGSTTMVLEGRVVNSPSDSTGERPVGNCLLLLQKKAKGT